MLGFPLFMGELFVLKLADLLFQTFLEFLVRLNLIGELEHLGLLLQ